MSSAQHIIIYMLIFCAGFFLLQSMIGFMGQAGKNVRMANERLRRLAKTDDKVDVLDKMRRARSLTKEGQLAGLNKRVSRVIMQSGLPLGPYGFYYACLGFAFSLGITLFLIKGYPTWGFIGFFIGGFAPYFILNIFVKRRQKKALAQLPEALDVIIRSLAAGHPVPVAMALVAREMPDPIGSEFGIASDEISFGSTISAAIQKMADRIGHDDFELFSAMIRLQQRTGGNLANLLRSNAQTIRGRQKMRLKIKAASAEGRVSAMILNAAPVILFLAVNTMSPDFYGEVKHLNSAKYTLIGAVLWMGVGNILMYKMINFKI